MSFYDAVGALDAPLLAWIDAASWNTPSVGKFILGLSGLYLVKGIPFCAFLWWVWFQRLHVGSARPDYPRRFVVRAVGGILLATLLGRVLQLALPFRVRPIYDSSIVHSWPQPADLLEITDSWSSFPSDHAVILAAFAASVWLWSWKAGIAAVIWVGLLALFPRVYLGLHFPSDELAGIIVGGLVAVLAIRMPLPERWIAMPLRLSERYPTWFYAVAFMGLYQLGTNFTETRHLLNGVLSIVSGA